MSKRILVSACLLGIECKYDCKGRRNEKVAALAEKYELVLVCPEQLGGLPTPRERAEQRDGRVYAESGEDVTDNYNIGAEITLQTARQNRIEFAVLKARSPSCGAGKIYDGTFFGKLKEGDGVATALLKKNGYEVKTEEDL